MTFTVLMKNPGACGTGRASASQTGGAEDKWQKEVVCFPLSWDWMCTSFPRLQWSPLGRIVAYNVSLHHVKKVTTINSCQADEGGADQFQPGCSELPPWTQTTSPCYRSCSAGPTTRPFPSSLRSPGCGFLTAWSRQILEMIPWAL